MTRSPLPVLHLVWGLETGGAQRIIAAIARHSPAGEFEHGVVSFNGDGPARTAIESAGCHATLLHKRCGFDPAMPGALRSLMARSAAGILHAHDFTGAFWGALALRSFPGWRLVVTDHLASQTLRSLKRRLYARVLRRSDMVVALGNSTLARLRTWGVNEKKLALGPIGPDLPQADPGARLAIRSELGVGPDKVIVLTCARLEAQKNLFWWLDIAVHADPCLVFVIAGEGSLASELSRRIKMACAEGRICLLGLRDDVQNLLAAADIFALPSAFEELPVSVLEAMAAGLPVVATPAGILPELMTSEGDCAGCLIPASAPSQWLDCLAKLAANSATRSRMGAMGRALVSKRYDVTENVAGLANLYARVAAGSKGSA